MILSLFSTRIPLGDLTIGITSSTRDRSPETSARQLNNPKKILVCCGDFETIVKHTRISSKYKFSSSYGKTRKIF